MSDTRKSDLRTKEKKSRHNRREDEIPRVCHQCGEPSSSQICDACWAEVNNA